MNTNAAIFHCKRKKALEKETDSHFVGADSSLLRLSYPTMACARRHALFILSKRVNREEEDTISSKGCFLVLPPMISY